MRLERERNRRRREQEQDAPCRSSPWTAEHTAQRRRRDRRASGLVACRDGLALPPSAPRARACRSWIDPPRKVLLMGSWFARFAALAQMPFQTVCAFPGLKGSTSSGRRGASSLRAFVVFQHDRHERRDYQKGGAYARGSARHPVERPERAEPDARPARRAVSLHGEPADRRARGARRSGRCRTCSTGGGRARVAGDHRRGGPRPHLPWTSCSSVPWSSRSS